MALTAYTGPPGAGKSYALVSQVILPGLKSGRRVVTNVAGLEADNLLAYLAIEGTNPAKLGELVLFEGSDALDPEFFPYQEQADTGTFIKGGDLLVFDEWALVFPRTGKLPGEVLVSNKAVGGVATVAKAGKASQVELFLRWHRHLTNDKGVTCDVVIATQSFRDINLAIRPLVDRSYKFRKLGEGVAKKFYSWHVYRGDSQSAGNLEHGGNGSYKDEITALYKSHDFRGEGEVLESNTDKRAGGVTRKLALIAVGAAVLFAIGGWRAYSFFAAPEQLVAPPTQAGGVAAPGGVVAAPARSPLRIVGSLAGGVGGLRVVVMSDSGGLRMLPPDAFRFVGDRPVSGFVDGQEVFAEDRFAPSREVAGAVFDQVQP